MPASSLDLDDPQPPYQQVAAKIRAAIASDELPVGEQLKSVRELAQEHGVSTGTVQQALRVLRAEGVITSWQGRGTFVRKQPGETEPETIDGPAIMAHLDAILDRIQRLEAQVAALETRQTSQPKRSRDA
jgi:DNA-binding GntR family transcriptional regulator